MDLVRTTISLSNPLRADLDPIEVDAWVDTGAPHLCLPRHVVIQLQLEACDTREVTVADGSRYVGPVATASGRRRCLGGAMVFGNDVRLGTISMDDMDLVVRLPTRQVGPNPLNPNRPASVAMGVRPAIEDR